MEWVGEEDWISERTQKCTPADETNFVTFALDSVTLSTVHRREKVKVMVRKSARKRLEPADATKNTREEGPTVQLCGDSEVVGKWINGRYSLGQTYQGTIGQIQKTLYPCWKRKIANPISKIDNYVKHIFWEHDQEADRWANLDAEGQRDTSNSGW